MNPALRRTFSRLSMHMPQPLMADTARLQSSKSALSTPGVPMKFPVWAENFQIKYLNPIISPIAKYLPGMAIISHRGRTSGTVYETPAIEASHGLYSFDAVEATRLAAEFQAPIG